ncbi:MAG: HEAT repeat domain-containing protein [bacterium]|nr:HEAT repeat domain-containing protein [bacterium]
MIWSTLLLVCASSAAEHASAGIVWEASFERAAERAASEKRILFAAVLEPPEARSRAFLGDLYGDRAIGRWSEDTVNVIGISGALGKTGKSPVKGLAWDELRRAEADLRTAHLSENDDGHVATPQHLWLDPVGEVLLCVPYEMTAEEMIWCFHEAQRLVDPAASGPRPEGAHPPRRLLVREVYTPPNEAMLVRGRTPDELDAQIESVRASFGLGRRGWAAILFTAEKEAAAYSERELGSGVTRWGGGELQAGIVRAIGLLAPRENWKVLGRFANDRSGEVRREVAVAFEQLGAPSALKVVRKALADEDDEALEPLWWRALAATGRADKRTRGTLLKLLGKEDDVRRRAHLLFALGYLAADDGVREALTSALAAEIPDERIVAACAMALSRDLALLGPLETARERSEDEALNEHFDRALEVLRGGSLYRIEESVRKVCGDGLERQRLFFRARGEAPRGARGR